MCFDAVWKIFPVSWRQFWITPFLTFMVMASFRTFRRSAVIPRTELMNTIDSFNLRYFSWPQVSVNFRYQAKTSIMIWIVKESLRVWSRNHSDRFWGIILALWAPNRFKWIPAWFLVHNQLFPGVWSKMSALTQRAGVHTPTPPHPFRTGNLKSVSGPCEKPLRRQALRNGTLFDDSDPEILSKSKNFGRLRRTIFSDVLFLRFTIVFPYFRLPT